VDWTGLTTFKEEDNIPYKYGNRYFTIEEGVDENKIYTTVNIDNEEMNVHKTVNFYEPAFRNLKAAHPHHAYIVEPIPKEELDEYIKLFYW
jgi:hypothetical protein